MVCINLSKSVPEFNNIFNNDFDMSNCLISIKNISHYGRNYKVVKYKKEDMDNSHISSFGLCRSIVLNEENKCVVYSPPKCLNTETFMEKYPTLNDNCIVEEMVEGTMINMFWNEEGEGEWEIATKGVVGANTRFFNGPYDNTFKNMFFEAFEKCGLTYDALNKEYCHSFVLQHPNNRIVVPFYKASLKLVAVYKIATIEGDIIVEHIDKYSYWKTNFSQNTSLQLNDVYDLDSYENLNVKYASNDTRYDTLGYVIYNKDTGERMKVRNPVYEKVKRLRGNQSKLQFQYLTLRTQGKVKEYLKYYPENKLEFAKYRDIVHYFTYTLYAYYRNCFVKKEKPLREYGAQFRTHMYKIHEAYKNELKEEGRFVDNAFVVKYVNELAPEYLMYSLNYHYRKQNVDYKVMDDEEL